MAGAALALGISLPVGQQAAAHVTAAGYGGGWSSWGTGIATTAQSKSNCPNKSAPTIRDGFPQPRYLESQNGRLFVKLRAQLGPTEIGGQIYESTTYNGEYPGPTLVVCPGDVMRVNVRNALDPADYQPPPMMHGEHGDIRGQTNLHTHGFHVSPRRPSDNIFVVIKPGKLFKYRYEIPRDHPPGFYWYHPHRHGQTNVQDTGGMNGGIIVKGGVDGAKRWRKIGTRDLVLNQTALGLNALGQPATFQPDPQGPFAPGPVACPPAGTLPCTQLGTQWFLNGASNPTIDIQPGALQRWRILNSSGGSFACVQLQGPIVAAAPDGPPLVPASPQPFQVLANDGNYLRRLTTADTMLIGPSSRREILVIGPPVPGTYALNQLSLSDTGCIQGQVEQTLATVNSSGPRVDAKLPPRSLPDQQRDLRDDEIDTRHRIVYSQDSAESKFFINGEQFTSPDDVMERMELNKTAQWTIQNTTAAWHTFHIHINDFQITKINGKPVDHVEFDDNVSIPPNQSVTMRQRPTDFTGKFVFHCHVLGHEDNGMMAVVQVVKKLPD